MSKSADRVAQWLADQVLDPWDGRTLFVVDLPGYYRYTDGRWEQVMAPKAPFRFVRYGHRYISTACGHGLHTQCRVYCKYCQTPCQCPCTHNMQQHERADLIEAAKETLRRREQNSRDGGAVVARLLELGMSYREIERTTGIPLGTAHCWATQPDMRREREHQPERESPNGESSPGPDPDQNDHPQKSDNGNTGRRDE